MFKMRKLNQKYRFLGFTLAEVLITLGIIGVVASITIPTLIADSHKAEYVAKLQKTTSVLSNGFTQIMVNNGCSDMACTGIMGLNGNNTVDNIKNANVFSIVKSCHATETGCDDSQLYYLSGGQAWIPSDNYAMIVLKDGAIVGFSTVDSSCNISAGVNQYATVCNSFGFIDVNGMQMPNKFGRDAYRFYLSKYGKILPVGTTDNTTGTWGYWNVNGGHGCTNGNGQTCFGRIMEQGWQMNY